MGRFRDMSTDDGSDTGVDMSPLIDCVFILLIFFIVTTTFIEEDGIEVDRPEAAAATNTESTSVILRLTAKGEVWHERRSIGLSGVQPLVTRAVQRDDENVPVIVQAQEGARSGLLVRVVDEARLAGAKNVNVANQSG